MAISLLSYPPVVIPDTSISLMPVYNTIAFKVGSDNNTQCNMKYICDVYIDSTYITRLKLYPDLDGLAEFKVNRVLEDYLSSHPEINLFISTDNQISLLKYKLQFGEEYDTSLNCDGSAVTVYDNLAEVDNQFAFNGALQYVDFFNYINVNPSRFVLDSLNPGKFLTNQPDTILIGENDQATLSYINLPAVYYYGNSMFIEKFDSNGNILGTQTISLSPTGLVSNTFNTIGCGPMNINQQLGSSFIDSAVGKYRVSLKGSAYSFALNQNVACEYLGGNNFWSTDSYPGCSSFGITNVDKLVLTISDVTCSDTFKIDYTGGSFTEGKLYEVSMNVDNVNNPSSATQWFQFSLGGNTGSQNSGVGYFSDNITCGPGGVLSLTAYFDADTAGFGTHGASIISLQIIEVGPNRTSEYKTFEIDRRCSRFNPLRFFWLNTLGGYDSYSFNLAKTRQVPIQRGEYNKLLNSNYSVGDRGRTNTTIKANDRITATSNWLSEEESQWLEGLYTSSDVYVYDENQLALIPVQITSTQFEEKIKARTRNINQVIEFEYAFDKNIQRG